MKTCITTSEYSDVLRYRIFRSNALKWSKQLINSNYLETSKLISSNYLGISKLINSNYLNISIILTDILNNNYIYRKKNEIYTIQTLVKIVMNII